MLKLYAPSEGLHIIRFSEHIFIKMLVKHAVIIKDIQRQLFNRCSIGIRSIATASSATDSSVIINY